MVQRPGMGTSDAGAALNNRDDPGRLSWPTFGDSGIWQHRDAGGRDPERTAKFTTYMRRQGSLPLGRPGAGHGPAARAQSGHAEAHRGPGIVKRRVSGLWRVRILK